MLISGRFMLRRRLLWRVFVALLVFLLLPAPLLAAPPDELTAAIQPARIGIQVGHWRSNELPDELARLRRATGGSGGGVREVDLNLRVAQAVAARLREHGHVVDLLPATVPPAYRADVFLSIHADATASPSARGFKLARARFSRIPATDDQLVVTLRDEYGRATGLPWSTSITRNMTGYYAFNSRRFRHAIDPATPAVILEMGYLTNQADRLFLTERDDRVVDGIVNGLLRFVAALPQPAGREQPDGAPQDDCRRFAATDIEVCGPFLRAWETRGGLARFGYPISAEIEEADPATGEERTVQYFERARMEHAPEQTNTPGEIQLGLLGRLLTAGRAAEPPFARIQPFADSADRRYFPETGHALASGFLHYWSANGGLALFGFPISEELTERNPADGKEYTVQYFERARFEYHPEHKGTPYETELGLLGWQTYTQR